MYELKKKIGKVSTSKFVGTGPSSYEKRIYWAAVSRKLRNTAKMPSEAETPFFGKGLSAPQTEENCQYTYVRKPL